MSFTKSFEVIVARHEIVEARFARGAHRYLPTHVPWVGSAPGTRGALALALHSEIVQPISAFTSKDECARVVGERFGEFAAIYRCYVELACAADGPPERDAASELNRRRPLDESRDAQLARSYGVWSAAYVLGLLVVGVQGRTLAATQCAVEMTRSGRTNSDILLDAAWSLRRVSGIPKFG